MTCAGNCRHGECAKCDQWRKAYANFHTTHSPKSSNSGSTSTTSDGGSSTGTIQTTSSRGECKPHALTGVRPKSKATPAELEETRTQMLAVSYEDIKAEFLKSAEASMARKPRRKKAQAE